MPEIIDEYGGMLLAAISAITLSGFVGYELLARGSLLYRLLDHIANLYL